MTSSSGYSIRQGFETAVRWADSEGWEPGSNDAPAFYAADPGGFHGAEFKGELVATMSAVRVADSVAFLGFYIVKPALRGTGIGKALWDRTLKGLEGYVLAGDAVPAQISNYESEGFEVCYRNSRFAGPSPSGQPEPGQGEIRAGAISGFAASRMSSLGMRIGPVFSSNPEQAQALILSLAKGHDGRIAVDVPLPNTAAVEMLVSLGLEPEFETARIYRGRTPDLPLDRIFGITSLELG
ncbi:MAG: GNAT family N-acetyltransferase [Solirubrobacterales bacterium]